MRTSVFASRRRGGFTLIETVVTVGLIAVLAAFVIPTVIQKAGTADPVKVQNDLGTLQTALSTFGNDLKGVYPADLNSLTTRISSTSSLLDGTKKYDGSQVAQWNGPYIGATIPVAGRLATGYAAFFSDTLANYDATDNSFTVGAHTAVPLVAGASANFSAADPGFVAVEITGLTAAQAKALNKLIDGPDDADQSFSSPATSGKNITGRLRYDVTMGTATGPTLVYYLVVPITPNS